ncbi:hypothetical protein KM043_008137 [Ampulex compressa]|nr:hypothetical protein KM043_008137 [Ampulex compressa]
MDQVPSRAGAKPEAVVIEGVEAERRWMQNSKWAFSMSLWDIQRSTVIGRKGGEYGRRCFAAPSAITFGDRVRNPRGPCGYVDGLNHREDRICEEELGLNFRSRILGDLANYRLELSIGWNCRGRANNDEVCSLDNEMNHAKPRVSLLHIHPIPGMNIAKRNTPISTPYNPSSSHVSYEILQNTKYHPRPLPYDEDSLLSRSECRSSEAARP